MMLTILLAAVLAQDPDGSGQEPSPPEPMPIPRTAVLHRGEREIVVDGSLQDWPALPPLVLDDVRQVSGTAMGAWRGRGDLAARAFLLWDEEALWLAANVLDDWHVRLTENSPRLAEIPPADSLLLSIDPARDTRAIGNDRGRSEDVEFWFADVEGQERKVVLWDRFRGAARYAEEATAVVRHDEDEQITYYEVRLPWREILAHGEEASTGRVFDLQIVLDDFDEPTDPLPQTRVGWTFGMGPRIDPALFGSAILVDVSSEDLGGSAVPMPGIPPPPEIVEPPVPPDAYWTKLREALGENGPAIFGAEAADPRFAGGRERERLLAELDRHHATFPRVDHLEFQYRIHRRMVRESAGIAARGLPLFWDHSLERAARDLLASAPPERGYRLLRLPQSGFLVRSTTATFAIDPAGFGVDRWFGEALDFVLLTTPNDPTRRHDQLLVRMRSGETKRPILMHLAIHLPGMTVADLPLVVPGRTYEPRGLKVEVLGVTDEEGRVSSSVGYRVTWPDGTDLLVSGLALDENMVDRGRAPSCLLLSAMHERARVLGQRLDPALVVLGDVLECQRHPGDAGRVSIEEAYELQDGLRPVPSLLLAPGESWLVPPRGD